MAKTGVLTKAYSRLALVQTGPCPHSSTEPQGAGANVSFGGLAMVAAVVTAAAVVEFAVA